ncbi:MAG: membrane dipeptidase [Flavobacteriaceae bacterium]
MSNKRRKIIKALPLGTLFPTQMLSGFSPSFDFQSDTSSSKNKKRKIDSLYKNAIVIDGLVISRGWDKDSFKALEISGYTGFGTSLASANLSAALTSLSSWNQIIKDHPDKLILAKTAADFIRAKKEDKVAVLFGFQNATMIEKSIENIDQLYKAGTRWIQLTYNQRNLLGDGCTERTNAGLSDFGIEAVNRMNELGIIVDASHCGQQTTEDAIHFSQSGISINHSMCEALHKKHPRAKTDQQIKAMADKGGVIGMICLGYMIGPNLGSDTTFNTYLDHIDHAVQVAGIDHVGLAADFAIEGLKNNGATKENWYLPRLTRFKPSYKVQWPPWIPELDQAERYLNVAKGLDKRGYRTEEIEKILGLNWIRLYKSILK